MAISFVGASAGASTTAVVPAHAVGDTIFIYAWREASTTNPTIPAGYSTITNTTDGLAQSISLGYRVATGTSDGSNTWTNATQMAVAVFRGQNVSGNLTGVLGVSAAAASSTTAVYAAVTMQAATGSWMLGFGAHRSTDTNINTAPTGMTARASLTGGGEIAVHDTAGIVTSWGAQPVALGGTANNWMTAVLELLAGTSNGLGHVADTQGKVVADSWYSKANSRVVDSDDVFAAASITARSTVNIHKVLDLEYGQSDIVADSTYAYSAGGGGATAYPYVGEVAADAEASSDRFKTKDYKATVAADVEVSSTASKGKDYVGSLAAVAEVSSSPFKGKDYKSTVEGVVEAGAAYFSTLAAGTAKVYQGSVEATLQADSARSRGWKYASDTSAIIVVDSVYRSGAAVSRTYVGACEIVSELTSKVGKGKAYRADGRLVVEVLGDSVYSHPTAHPYTGTVILSGVADSAYSATLLGAVSFRVTESLPITAFTLEGKPTDGYSLEPVPGRPASQDGVYTEPVQDGAWDEFPVDGFYAPVGYFKEFKPFHRATMTKEPVPTRPAAQDGVYTEPGQDGFWDEYPKDGAYAPVGYFKEFKPFHRRR